MRRLISWFFAVSLWVSLPWSSWATTITEPKVWVTGDVLTAADLNAGFSTIVNDYNGSITPANFATTLTYASTQYSDFSAISPSTTKGIRLPAGTGGTNAGNLAWDATAVAGRLGDGTNANYLLNPVGQGTSGQVLQSAGANALPTWVSAPNFQSATCSSASCTATGTCTGSTKVVYCVGNKTATDCSTGAMNVANNFWFGTTSVGTGSCAITSTGSAACVDAACD